MILLEFRDFYTKGRVTDCKAAVRTLTGVIIVLLVIETHQLKEEEEEEEEETMRSGLTLGSDLASKRRARFPRIISSVSENLASRYFPDLARVFSKDKTTSSVIFIMITRRIWQNAGPKDQRFRRNVLLFVQKESQIPQISFVFFSKTGHQLLPTTSYNVFRL